MDEVYEVFRKAVLQRQQVLAEYAGSRRGFCPHALGWRAGEPYSLCYQFLSLDEPLLEQCAGAWCCIPLSGIAGAVVREGAWHTDMNTPPPACLDVVDVQVRWLARRNDEAVK
jgi:hypothetical protein